MCCGFNCFGLHLHSAGGNNVPSFVTSLFALISQLCRWKPAAEIYLSIGGSHKENIWKRTLHINVRCKLVVMEKRLVKQGSISYLRDRYKGSVITTNVTHFRKEKNLCRRFTFLFMDSVFKTAGRGVEEK